MAVSYTHLCYAFGRMFRSTYYDKWESESKTLEQSHGCLLYTSADGKPMEKEKSYTLKDGDIFCVVSPEDTFKVVIET